MDSLFFIETFLSIFISIYCLFLLKKGKQLKDKYNNLQNTCETRTTMLGNAEMLNSNLANKISELTSTVEIQKEHIQALRRAERRHKYLIKKLNPKNGKKSSLQDTQ